MTEDSLIESAEAWVTPEGIFFRGDYYSCKKALKEQWYQRAREAGSWRIEILLDRSKGCSSPKYISGSEVTLNDLCLPLGEPSICSPDERDHYQSKIRELRDRLQGLTDFTSEKNF